MSNTHHQSTRRWAFFAFVCIALALPTFACGTSSRVATRESPPQPQSGSGGQVATQPLSAAKAPSNPGPFDGIPVMEFTGSGSMNELPFNVMEEFYFGGQGGGGGPEPCDSYPVGKLIILDSPATIPLFAPQGMQTCGWMPGEQVGQTITAPDGSQRMKDMAASPAGGIYPYISPGYGDNLGTYHLALIGQSGSLETNFNVVDADSAVLSRIADGQMLLYGLRPNERVKIVHYASDQSRAVLDSWQTFKVDERGRLILKFAENYPILSVVAEQSDVAGGNPTGCNPKFPARLKPGMTARVAYTDGMNLLIREAPGKDEKVLARMKEGTQFTITGGPFCHYTQTVWYEAKSDKGVAGWVMEAGEDDYYYIEPKP